METLKRMECEPNCGFMVQSHDEKEVLRMGEEHARIIHHDTSMTEEKLRGMMKDA